ncbi:LamG-like jellyroll fold domain-containing protein [Flavivirga spongiicola]|uniref:Uncharacterized protein n=1 Tax=Flavivirga spongiicola TaxID=421621 RepID=A0ABU7XWA4_9FLAO|nr:LamG-like jellyroll fold domain-containing protein [Flavivirga sp. MEBiC05379]MDO5979843.1 LamG-like jellyroll fold domain-containing protein [Flavivirga sp. MEBiC05379]
MQKYKNVIHKARTLRGLVTLFVLSLLFLLGCQEDKLDDLVKENVLFSKTSASLASTSVAPIASWSFDVNANSDVGSYNGTLVGNAAAGVNDATRGNVLSLDGSGDYVDLPFVINPNTAFTASVWVKRANTTSSSQLILQQEGSNGRNYFILNTSNQITSWLGQSTTTGSSVINDTNWHHLAIVHNGSGSVTIYVDGSAGTANTGLSITSETGELLLGVNKTKNGSYFNGLIDDLAIFDQALSIADIQLLAETGSGLPTDLQNQGYVLTWSDEFNGTALDNTVWSPYLRGKKRDFIHPNDNFGYFSDMVSVSNGNLIVKSKTENGTVNERTVPTKSGAISTAHKFTYSYGYLEARIKFGGTNRSNGGGYIPAFWLDGLGDADNRSNHSSTYTKSGMPGWGHEVDILEAYQSSNDYVLHHNEGDGPWTGNSGHIAYGSGINKLNNGNDPFHTIGLLWTTSGFTMYFDGVKINATPNGNTSSATPKYIMLTAAAHAIPSAASGEIDMEVDYVRLYESPNNTGTINEWTEIDRSSWFTKASSTDTGNGTPTGGYWPARTVKVHGVGGIWYWRSAESQSPSENQWFKVDMGYEQAFKQLRIIAPGYTSASQENDTEGQYAANYEIYLSNSETAWTSTNVANWGTMIASGTGSAVTDECFTTAQSGRFITIRQTGTSTKKWSIRDIYAFKEDAYSGTTCSSTSLPNPLASWSFDVNADSDVGSYNGTLVGNATAGVNDATRGNVLSLDGTGDYVDLPFVINPNTAFTASVWVKRANTTSSSQLILQQEGTSGRNYFLLNTSNQITSWLGQSTTTGSSAVNDTNWHHLAIVHSGSGSVTIYVDGSAGTANTGLSVTSETGELLLGVNKAKNGSYFNGLIDNMKIYDSALNQTQINILANE